MKTRIVSSVMAVASVALLLPQVADAHVWGLRGRFSSSGSGSGSSGSGSSGGSGGSSSGGSSSGGSSSSAGGGASSAGGSAATSTLRIRLEARMRSGGVEAKLAFEDRGSRRKFEAEISRALPMATFAVMHNGVQIGTLTTNAFGAGRIEVNQGGDDANQGSVPVMRIGDRVSIGALSGTLARR